MRKEAFYNDSMANPPGYLPPDEYSAPDLILWDTSKYTDWQKELIGGVAQYRNYSASISGGNKMIKYLLKGTYQNQSTVMPGEFKDQRGSLHFNVENTSENRNSISSSLLITCIIKTSCQDLILVII